MCVCVEMNMGACVQLIRGGSGKTHVWVFYVRAAIMWRSNEAAFIHTFVHTNVLHRGLQSGAGLGL